MAEIRRSLIFKALSIVNVVLSGGDHMDLCVRGEGGALGSACHSEVQGSHSALLLPSRLFELDLMRC